MVVGTRGFRLVLNKAWLVVFLTTNVFTAFFTIVYMKIDDPLCYLIVQNLRATDEAKSNMPPLNAAHSYYRGKYSVPIIKHCDCPPPLNSMQDSMPILSKPMVIFITPTHTTDSQLMNLVVLCQTLHLAGNVMWIVVEDSSNVTDKVRTVLLNCPVTTVHLNVPTPREVKNHKWATYTKHRGVTQRNTALQWLRQAYTTQDCEGVVYFGDDDNKYHTRLFNEIRRTQSVSVWPVTFPARNHSEGPVCSDGHVQSWTTFWAKQRKFPIDMAGFAIHLCLLVQHSEALMSNTAQLGSIESEFLSQFGTKDSVECRGSHDEALVWHIKSYLKDY